MTKALKSGQSESFLVRSLIILSFAVSSCSAQKDQTPLTKPSAEIAAPDTKSNSQNTTGTSNDDTSRQFEAGKLKSFEVNNSPQEGSPNPIPTKGSGLTSTEFRVKLFQSLQEKMSESSRLSIAALYFKSFDFQNWTSQGMDNIARRNELAALAIQEFFSETKKLKNHLNTAVNPFSDSGKYAVLNILSLSMDYQSEVQSELINRASVVKPISILSVIEESLEIGKKLQGKTSDATNVPAYVAIVLKEKELALFLLNTRINSLVLSATNSLMSDRLSQKTTSQGFLSKLEDRLIENHCHLAKLSRHISPDISKLEASQLKKMSLNLLKATSEIEFLKSVDARPELHCSLKTLLSRIDLAPKKTGTGEQNSKLLAEELQIISLFVNLKSL